MPVTIGSVGDIVALCQILRDLLETLDESRGSTRDYQKAVEDIRNLQRLLFTLKDLTATCDSSSGYVALGQTARLKAQDCHDLIVVFHGKIDKYKKHLGNSKKKRGKWKKKTENAVRESFWKLHWRMSHKECVEQFRTNIRDHTQSITALLVSAHLNSFVMADERLRRQVEESSSQQEEYSAQQAAEVENIRKRLEQMEQVRLIAPSTDWITTLTKFREEFLQKAQIIWKVSYETWKGVVYIQSQLPRLLEPWSEQPVILDDAIGRVTRMPLELVDSWDIFEDVLLARFRDMPGLDRIAGKQYVLQDATMRKEISRNVPFKCSFRPGRRILMAALFSDDAIND
ncbi:uncharacterized protein BDZ99DRAFT_129393 [Mytilinidion resinicola]|uniref:Ubiquitin-like domain-containing protein n=1 Tax=Mytilinidion resinicola TaxID=574789 RepID=A0A6A6Z772_9PEZI|nr:uncharacterized protein BDZ99DRAFT_129393 [Mytilinidion resinicola]KAF2816127.1 hypothetical protein BDZ99DRAFT_129393 [Mytilinidion resinicola]